MTAGSKISCTAIAGDGCGGGREFIIENGTLYAYEELSDTKITLLKNIIEPISINKKGCIIKIICKNEIISFDLKDYKQSHI